MPEKKKLSERLERPSDRPTDPEALTTEPLPPKAAESEREPGLHVSSATYEKRHKPGRKNQDSFFHDLDDQGRSGTFLVADGVGGNPAGDVASGLIRERVKTENGQLRALQRLRREQDSDLVLDESGDEMREEDILKQILVMADQDIRNRAELDGTQGMSSTAVLARLVELPDEKKRELFVTYCGDSRAAIIKPDGALHTVTLDPNPVLQHLNWQLGREFALFAQRVLDDVESFEQYTRLSRHWTTAEANGIERTSFQMLDNHLGEKLAKHYFDLRTRTYSIGQSMVLDQTSVVLEPGSRVLLMTDGIHRNLLNREISAIVSGRFDLIEDEEVRNAAASAGRPADALVWGAQARADQKGINPRAIEDDMTVIVVE